uniref:Uncharacterized protein n=1 Tax=Macaca fascicularis TaxID=9541 RepID=A0A7N9CR97_MACFA
ILEKDGETYQKGRGDNLKYSIRKFLCWLCCFANHCKHYLSVSTKKKKEKLTVLGITSFFLRQ